MIEDSQFAELQGSRGKVWKIAWSDKDKPRCRCFLYPICFILISWRGASSQRYISILATVSLHLFFNIRCSFWKWWLGKNTNIVIKARRAPLWWGEMWWEVPVQKNNPRRNYFEIPLNKILQSLHRAPCNVLCAEKSLHWDISAYYRAMFVVTSLSLSSKMAMLWFCFDPKVHYRQHPLGNVDCRTSEDFSKKLTGNTKFRYNLHWFQFARWQIIDWER